MPRKIVDKREITISEARRLLEDAKELNQFQVRTLEYAKKFSRTDPSKAERLVDLLVEKFGIERTDAVQVVNCMPESVQELRVFFSTGMKRVILTSQLEEMLRTLDEYR